MYWNAGAADSAGFALAVGARLVPSLRDGFNGLHRNIPKATCLSPSTPPAQPVVDGLTELVAQRLKGVDQATIGLQKAVGMLHDERIGKCLRPFLQNEFQCFH